MTCYVTYDSMFSFGILIIGVVTLVGLWTKK